MFHSYKKENETAELLRQPWWTTPSSNCVIVHIVRKANVINVKQKENDTIKHSLTVYLAMLPMLPLPNEFPRKTSWLPRQLLW